MGIYYDFMFVLLVWWWFQAWAFSKTWTLCRLNGVQRFSLLGPHVPHTRKATRHVTASLQSSLHQMRSCMSSRKWWTRCTFAFCFAILMQGTQSDAEKRHMWPEKVVIYGCSHYKLRKMNIEDMCHQKLQMMMDPSYLGCIFCIWSGIMCIMWNHVIWTPLHGYTSNHPSHQTSYTSSDRKFAVFTVNCEVENAVMCKQFYCTYA